MRGSDDWKQEKAWAPQGDEAVEVRRELIEGASGIDGIQEAKTSFEGKDTK